MVAVRGKEAAEAEEAASTRRSMLRVTAHEVIDLRKHRSTEVAGCCARATPTWQMQSDWPHRSRNTAGCRRALSCVAPAQVGASLGWCVRAVTTPRMGGMTKHPKPKSALYGRISERRRIEGNRTHRMSSGKYRVLLDSNCLTPPVPLQIQ